MKQRIISAAVAIAIVIPLFLLGGVFFSLGVIAITALAYVETLNLKKSHHEYPKYMKMVGFISLLLIVLSNIIGESYNGLSYVGLGIASLIVLIPSIFEKDKYTTRDAFHMLGMNVLIGLFFNIMNVIMIEGSKWVLLYIILIAVITDTFAMLGGCLFGKHKLIPEVSPKKTIEGSIIGSILATIICTIYYVLVVFPLTSTKLNIILLIIMTLILSILGQLGDLLFSKIKRENDIKDFSNIMPGHGGILDRFDSMTFIAIGYTIISFFINLI